MSVGQRGDHDNMRIASIVISLLHVANAAVVLPRQPSGTPFSILESLSLPLSISPTPFARPQPTIVSYVIVTVTDLVTETPIPPRETPGWKQTLPTTAWTNAGRQDVTKPTCKSPVAGGFAVHLLKRCVGMKGCRCCCITPPQPTTPATATSTAAPITLS